MRLDFSIIGAAKSGTTALFDAVCGHPGVFRPSRKELNYWAYDATRPGLLAWGAEPDRDWPARTFDEYAAYFAGAPGGALLGEASVVYLESEFAPARLAEHNPELRVVAVLRDPVARAWSGYWMARRNGWTTDTLEEAFRPGADRVHSGRYGFLLSRWYDRFPSGQVFVEDHDRLASDPDGVLADLFSFLGLPPEDGARLERVNTGGAPVSTRLHRALHSRIGVRVGQRVRGTPIYDLADRLRKRNLKPLPPMDADTAARLREFYGPDVAELERLTGRDFSHWKDEAGGRR